MVEHNVEVGGLFVSEIRAQYRDADSLLFHGVVKRIYEEQVGERWIVRKVEIVYESGDPEQPIEYCDGWIIPPEWEFMSERWTSKRKPVSKTVYAHDSKVQLLDGDAPIIKE